MHNPPHPGLTLRDDVLPALAMGVSEAAEQLGVSRQALSSVLNGRAAISPEMALRLEAWLGADNGGRADLWLSQQDAFDLWQTRQQKRQALKAIERVEPFAIAGRSLALAAEPAIASRAARPSIRRTTTSGAAMRRKKA